MSQKTTYIRVSVISQTAFLVPKNDTLTEYKKEMEILGVQEYSEADFASATSVPPSMVLGFCDHDSC